MADDKSSPNSNGETQPRVALDYIKSEYFRVIRADGAIGSLTPNGHIHMTLFSERLAIPRRQVYELVENRLGSLIESETVTRDSIVREMDVDVFLTIDIAKQIQQWLGDRIEEAQAKIAATTNTE